MAPTVGCSSQTCASRHIRNEIYGREEAVQMHRAWLTGKMTDEVIEARYLPLVAKHLISRRHHVLDALSELRGMNLACWCPPSEACHADLLLQLANER